MFVYNNMVLEKMSLMSSVLKYKGICVLAFQDNLIFPLFYLKEMVIFLALFNFIMLLLNFT